jgi:hypothetical protein
MPSPPFTWGRKHPVSETSCFIFSRIPDNGKKSQNPVILCVIHHRQNPLEFIIFLVWVNSFIHSLMALQPFFGPWPLLRFWNLIYTEDRTPWTSDQLVARSLRTHRTTQTQNKRTQKHPCLAWDSNPLSQRSSERIQFMLQTAQPLH